MNQTILNGNLTRDAEFFPGDGDKKPFVRLSLATSQGRDDEKHTQYHTVVTWDSLADAAQGLAQGQRLLVVGRSQTQRVQGADGEPDRFFPQVVAYEIAVPIRRLPGADNPRGDQ